MTNPTSNVPIEPVSEILEGVERRRRWSPEEKLRIVEETDEPGRSVSLVARRYGLAANQVFKWKRLIGRMIFNLRCLKWGCRCE